MRVTALFFSLFLSIISFANNDNGLIVEQNGLIIEVMYFEEGDKLKLFEVETGDHILSKSYSHIDLSQLPVGSYLLENNQGKSIVIDRLEEELMIDGAIEKETENFFVEENDLAEETAVDQGVTIEQEFVHHYINSQKNQLSIEREGDMITVVDFEEGDKLKLFEVKDTVHILSKTTNIVDLSQLPVGLYVLENSEGESVVVEKFTEVKNNITDI